MRDIDRDTITDAVIGTFASDTEPRTREVLEALVRHLHEFAREVELTQDEWLAAMDFAKRAGEASDASRNEFILASDVLGLTSLVDVIGNSRTDETVTDSSVLGPFHVTGAPFADDGVLPGPIHGPPALVHGQVLSADGSPLPGAVLDVWGTGENGLYDVQDESTADGSHRGRVRAGAGGAYRFVTAKPAPYTVPTDGPVGDFLEAVGRHPWRPAHLHLIVSAEGHAPLVTELFAADDPYIEEDAVFGVRDSIAVAFEVVDDRQAIADAGLDRPFVQVEFDFRLQPDPERAVSDQTGWQGFVEMVRGRGVLGKQLYVITTEPVSGLDAVRGNLPDHLAYQESLEASGVMFAAGPFADDDEREWSGAGMVIVRAASLADARAIAEADPMHARGARRYRIRPWLLNEGALTVRITYSDGGREII